MTETKTINLTISERIALIGAQRGLLNGYKGKSIEVLATLFDDVKKLAVQEDEWKAANMVKTPLMEDGKQIGETAKWDDKGSEKDIVLAGSTIDAIASLMKEREDAGEISIADAALITIKQKIS